VLVECKKIQLELQRFPDPKLVGGRFATQPPPPPKIQTPAVSLSGVTTDHKVFRQFNDNDSAVHGANLCPSVDSCTAWKYLDVSAYCFYRVTAT